MGTLLSIIALVPPYWSTAYVSTANAPTNSGLKERYREQEFTAKRSISIQATKEELQDYLAFKTANTGLYEEMCNVIQCESSWKPNAVGDSGLAFGILQYHRPTFDNFCKGDYYNPYDQIDCAISMFQNNLKNHWSCYRQLVSSDVPHF